MKKEKAVKAVTTTVRVYTCLRCGNVWQSRLPVDQMPKRCPGCGSGVWQKAPVGKK